MNIIKRTWAWLGKEQNHNASMVVITSAALIFALPYFSRQINNVEVKVDSLESSIKNIYGSYILETFCYEELKDSFKKTDLGNTVEIHLKNKAISNSVNVWEGAMNLSPAYFRVNGNMLDLSTNMDPVTLKEYCLNNSDFKYSVTYIPNK